MTDLEGSKLSTIEGIDGKPDMACRCKPVKPVKCQQCTILPPSLILSSYRPRHVSVLARVPVPVRLMSRLRAGSTQCRGALPLYRNAGGAKLCSMGRRFPVRSSLHCCQVPMVAPHNGNPATHPHLRRALAGVQTLSDWMTQGIPFAAGLRWARLTRCMASSCLTSPSQWRDVSPACVISKSPLAPRKSRLHPGQSRCGCELCGRRWRLGLPCPAVYARLPEGVPHQRYGPELAPSPGQGAPLFRCNVVVSR